MKKIIIIFQVILSFFYVAKAQTQLFNNEQEQLNETLQNIVQNLDGNTVILKQEGKLNSAIISQSQIFIGEKNYMEVNQEGVSHNIDIDVSGGGNGLRVTQIGQIGGGHAYIGDIDGNDNIINISQTGMKNTIEQRIVFVDGLNFDISQTGSENTLELINNGSGVTPDLIIEQKGQGMSITIENNVMLPLK